MSPPPAPDLTSLLKRTTIEDHNEILQASNAALKSSKNDIGIQHVKAVALLKLERYEEVIRFIEESGQSLQEQASLEYAYALYKSGRWHDAAEIATKQDKLRGSQQLEAQSRYRAEQFREAADIYKTLSQSPQIGEDFDLKVNESAVNAQLHWARVGSVEAKKPGREDLEAFETTYNAACGSIARGEFGQAEVLLERAKQLCQHSDELSAEQKMEEVLPICVQQIYVLQKLGKVDEAESLISNLQIEQIPDLSTRKIALNNSLLGSRQPLNPFLVYKTFHTSPSISENDRPFSFQQRLLISNEASMALRAFKSEGIASSTQRQLRKYPGPSVSPEVAPLSAIYASAVATNEIGSAALKRVLPELEKRPNDVGLLLTVTQLYVSTGNMTAATQLMESFFQRVEQSISDHDKEVRFNPGLVSVLVGLYRQQGRKSHIKQELAKAASHWRRRSKPPASLLQAAGASLLESSDSQNAAMAREIFSKLYEEHKEDRAAVAGYVASHSSDANQKDIDKLSPVEQLIGGVNVDALESVGIPQASNALALAQRTSRKRPKSDQILTQPKRIRKSRLPKDYDPSKTPDPERWLPLRDRSSYRPKGKKKSKRGGDDRTQGGVVTEDAGINGVNAPKPQATAGGGGTNKKKKGKGKK